MACASTSRSSLSVSCGRTSSRNRRMPRRLDGSTDDCPSLHRATLIAEQHEMPVGKPAQQRRDVLAVGGREASLRVGVEFVGQTEQRSGQRPRVERNLAGVGEHAGQQAPGLRDRLGVDGTGQLDVDPRLVDAVVGVVGLRGRPDVQQLTGRAAPHPQHRVHDRLVGHAEPVQQHGHGVHQHRRVVGDDLHRGTEPGRVVVRIELDERLPDPPPPAQLVVRGQQGRRHQLARRRHVDRTGGRLGDGASPCGP